MADASNVTRILNAIERGDICDREVAPQGSLLGRDIGKGEKSRAGTVLAAGPVLFHRERT
jgi:hypothetical protein